jgi:hypothetical protein
MARSRERVLQKVRESGGRAPTFAEYFESLAVPFAEGYADRVGELESSRRQGIDGLLRLDSVQAAVWITLSYAYAQTVEGRVPKQSDVILASAADVFLVHDEKLRRLVDRITGVEACDLSQLLARLRKAREVK